MVRKRAPHYGSINLILFANFCAILARCQQKCQQFSRPWANYAKRAKRPQVVPPMPMMFLTYRKKKVVCFPFNL
jgi:hypothetical protein